MNVRFITSILAIIICITVFPIRFSQADAIYHFKTSKQESQFKHLLTELRCLVCQNQDLADSDAGLAYDLRMKIYNKVKEGQTDQEIINYLTERYGDFILFKPKLKSMTFFLWFAPLIFLGIGLLVFSRKFR